MVESISKLMTGISAIALLAFAATGAANANPNIQPVFPNYDGSGNAASLTVDGSGFSGDTVVVRVDGMQQTVLVKSVN